jgi:hypothetical protein
MSQLASMSVWLFEKSKPSYLIGFISAHRRALYYSAYTLCAENLKDEKEKHAMFFFSKII